ncbi:MAG: FABP family protein [Actinomycetota bacterium]
MSTHPALAPLLGLVGTWRGRGSGEYPTIEPFDYLEEITLAPGPGTPFLAYSQRTRHADDERPLHAETGYWRPVGSDGIELVLAHPTGAVERLCGSWDGSVADLSDDAVAVTPTAKSVTCTRRRFELDGDVLRYSMAMAAVGEPLTHHLAAELRRVS